MTHRDALTHPHRRDQPPACAGDLIAPRRGFWDDVLWTTFDCAGCGVRVVTVGGAPHWWNHELPPRTAGE